MKQKTFKKLLMGVGSVQLLLGLGIFTAADAIAAPQIGSNVAVSSTANAQQVAALVAKIKEGAPSGLTNKNIATAIKAAISASGGKPSTAVMAAALNQLNLSGSALNKAVSTAFEQIGGKQYELVAAMLKDAKAGGEAKYVSTLSTFNNALGKDTVSRAADKVSVDTGPQTVQVSMSLPTGNDVGNIANIEPAAGDVYNG